MPSSLEMLELEYSCKLKLKKTSIHQVCELERVMRVCDGFFCRISVTYDGAVLL